MTQLEWIVFKLIEERLIKINFIDMVQQNLMCISDSVLMYEGIRFLQSPAPQIQSFFIENSPLAPNEKQAIDVKNMKPELFLEIYNLL